ncbi:hypothetical protein GCM10008101_22460 [Lysobacter xinjiangensis]|uniref:Uncharacterized protein n=1 Tax=Cognatilysobacter xinjiangensis TaxID=546892 RepID=A0ABQ3C4K5_9GAMM|nr:hypothetical protein [Lysobacter xinjiangensis]GGZ67703.1 hypothetical protein GCM10008101_22460 [Lysobacter xinjiangensis]
MTARSDHLQPTPDDRFIDIDPSWLDFGPDDPLDAQRWLNACADCGGAPSLAMNELRWQVRCDCGRAGTPGQLAAIAAVNWNKSPLSLHPAFGELPFFALDGLSIPAARAKLIRIREYLEEQKRRCERRIRARENFGHRYFQRIRAYLAWAIYAQGLVREAETRLLDEASRRKAANAH